MKTWLFGILTVSVLSVVLGVLYRGGKLYKPIMGVLTMLLAVSLLRPLLAIKNGNTEWLPDLSGESAVFSEISSGQFCGVRKKLPFDFFVAVDAGHGVFRPFADIDGMVADAL